MKNIVVIGAGFAGHTAALYLGQELGSSHRVTVINLYENFYYIPAWVWVGEDRMAPEKARFPLAPVYKRKNVNFVQGRAHTIDVHQKHVMVTPTGVNGNGSTTPEDVKVDYDYLVIATGPKLNFAGTPGLGPSGGYSHSICSEPHVLQTRDAYREEIGRMEKGEKRKLVFGTGHPSATCQGAAFEFITNVHKDLVRRGLRDKADIHWISNERALGDFGVRGVHVTQKGKTVSSDEFIGAVFDDYGITHEVQRGVKGVEPGKALWEDYDGNEGETGFDFAMLIPQFTGQPFNFVGENGADVKDKLTNPAGFIKVDGIYGLDYPTLARNPDAWPAVYQNPDYPEVFAAGIAFAPPGPISQPHTNPNGMAIAAAPPRTGMVSGIIGRIVAKNIIDLVHKGRMTHAERMSEMSAACIASMGDSLWDGSAATIVVYPVVPDMRRFPNEHGRDRFVTHMEMGLAGAWMKRMIQSTFMYKLKGLPGWQIIPE